MQISTIHLNYTTRSPISDRVFWESMPTPIDDIQPKNQSATCCHIIQFIPEPTPTDIHKIHPCIDHNITTNKGLAENNPPADWRRRWKQDRMSCRLSKARADTKSARKILLAINRALVEQRAESTHTYIGLNATGSGPGARARGGHFSSYIRDAGWRIAEHARVNGIYAREEMWSTHTDTPCWWWWPSYSSSSGHFFCLGPGLLRRFLGRRLFWTTVRAKRRVDLSFLLQRMMKWKWVWHVAAAGRCVLVKV